VEQYLEKIVANGSLLILSGMVAAALFFAMAGLRELKDGCNEGLLYLTLALFFAIAHLYLLYGTATANHIDHPLTNLDLWGWLIVLVAPALIVLYLGFGLLNFLTARFREAMIKTFFGLTLVCYLYMLGAHWPIDVRGILILIWSGLWFNLELTTAA